MRAMTVRVDVVMAEPLDAEGRTRLLLATAAMPEVRRVIITLDGRRATIYAGEVSAERVQAALLEGGIGATVRCSLSPEAEAVLVAGNQERFRPIGR